MKVKILQKTLPFLLIFFISLFSGFLTLEIFNLDKVALGTTIADLEIGGLDTDKTQILLEKHFAQWEDKNIVFTYQGKNFKALPEEIGISLDAKETLNQAYNFGRDKNILIGISKQVSAILPLGSGDLPPAYDFNEDQFKQFAAKTFIGYENPAKNASLAYNFKTKEWQTTKEKSGVIFDRQKLENDLAARINNLDDSPIQLVLINDEPEVLENETEQAKKQAANILKNASYLLKYGEKTWPLDKETLMDWIEFVPANENNNNKILGVSFDQKKIKDVLTGVTPLINREPVNAQLATEDGKVAAFVLSQDGVILNIEKSSEKIIKSIIEQNKNDNSFTSAAPDNEIELVVERKPPRVSTEGIDTLGLTKLIGKGESNFAGSPKNRTHNIKTGTAKFNGVLIAPGEEFSFNTILGEIGPEQGYLPELVIKNHKTIPEYGGGICQVSTTIFRAAINSGLEITERYPHAFPVKYYSPQGFDSTIYPPHPDLRFINDTPRYILMQSKIEGTKLTFEFYGTDDGREVKIKGPTVLSSNPDGSMKTILYQEVWRDGQMEHQSKFPSNYKSPDLYPREEKNPLE